MRFFLSKGRKQPGWLAIDVQPAQVDLVHVRRGVSGRPEIALCDSYKIEGGAVETLVRLRKELKLDQYRCTTLLRFADYQMHSVDAPAVPAAELKNAVRWRVKDIIDYPLEQATVDVFSVPDAKGSIENPKSVYAVTARNDSVGKIVRPFNESNVPLESVDIPAMAQRNIARLHEQEGRGLAVLAFYDECGKLTISAGGELFMTRRVEVTRREGRIRSAIQDVAFREGVKPQRNRGEVGGRARKRVESPVSAAHGLDRGRQFRLGGRTPALRRSAFLLAETVLGRSFLVISCRSIWPEPSSSMTAKTASTSSFW